MLLTYGKFKYLNLIDMDWEKEIQLTCPVNKVGKVTLYQTSRHGSFDAAGAPAFLNAIQPQVVVVNNGPRKGMGQVDANVKSNNPPGKVVAPWEKNAYLRMTKIPGIEGIWQEHLSLLDPDPDPPNPSWLTLIIGSDREHGLMDDLPPPAAPPEATTP